MNREGKPSESDVSIKRIGRNGYLHRIITIFDKSGNVVQRIVKPLMVEFRARDVMQTVVGASILAIPAAYTEEAWNLGSELPLLNIGLMGGCRLFLWRRLSSSTFTRVSSESTLASLSNAY